jgi:hypothetical protein
MVYKQNDMYRVPINEDYRIEELLDGSLAFELRTGEIRVVPASLWNKDSMGWYVPYRLCIAVPEPESGY